MSVPRISEEFWEDADWAKVHYGELQRRYKNVWVAIAGRRVVSYGRSLREVEFKAEKIVGKKDIFTMYVESGAAIYQS